MGSFEIIRFMLTAGPENEALQLTTIRSTLENCGGACTGTLTHLNELIGQDDFQFTAVLHQGEVFLQTPSGGNRLLYKLEQRGSKLLGTFQEQKIFLPR